MLCELLVKCPIFLLFLLLLFFLFFPSIFRVQIFYFPIFLSLYAA